MTCSAVFSASFPKVLSTPKSTSMMKSFLDFCLEFSFFLATQAAEAVRCFSNNSLSRWKVCCKDKLVCVEENSIFFVYPLQNKLILSVIYRRDPTRYYACARLVILRERSPSCRRVWFSNEFFPVNLRHPVEICEANQFLSKVSFTFPWWRRKIAWMGYWKKPDTQNLARRSRVIH